MVVNISICQREKHQNLVNSEKENTKPHQTTKIIAMLEIVKNCLKQLDANKVTIHLLQMKVLHTKKSFLDRQQSTLSINTHTQRRQWHYNSEYELKSRNTRNFIQETIHT